MRRAGRDDAVADRRDQAEAFASRNPDYRQLRLEQVDHRGYPAADWEFTYTDDGTPLHVLNRVFNVNGTGHSLYFQVRAEDWPAAKADFDRIAQRFEEAGR